MARFPCKRAAPAAALLMALVLPAIRLAVPAEVAGELEFKNWSRLEVLDDSTWIYDAVITHGNDMYLTAKLAHRVDLPGNASQLTLSGGVHIDFRGAVLDADSALIMFRGQQLQSGKVQGSQATFSHQRANSSRRVNGRADAIEFEGSSNRIRFKGNTFYTDGSNRCSIEELNYNLTDGSFSNTRAPGQAGDSCIVKLDSFERVPPPRTPERSTAQ